MNAYLLQRTIHSPTQFLFLLCYIAITLRQSLGIGIYYLRESTATFGIDTGPESRKISDLVPGFPGASVYGMGAWVNKIAYSGDWEGLFRITNDISTDGHFGRLLFVQTNINTTWIFVYGTTTEFGNETKSFCDNVWPHGNSEASIPVNEWTYVYYGWDLPNSKYAAFIYKINSGLTMHDGFVYEGGKCGNTQPMSATTSWAYWGGAFFWRGCNCQISYVSLHLDYIPRTKDEMMTAALMDPAMLGTLYVFNTSFIIPPAITSFTRTNEIDDSSIITTIGFVQEMPDSAPYSVVNCRPGRMLSFSIGSSADGFVLAMHFKPLPTNDMTKQTIFGISNAADPYEPYISAKYDPMSKRISVLLHQLEDPNSVSPTTQLTENGWNRIVFEIIPAMPRVLNVGNSSSRIWINDSSVNNSAYLGDSDLGSKIFQGATALILTICSRNIDGSDSQDGNFDFSNLLYFDGAESLYQNSSDQSCDLAGFLFPNERACLICAEGYYHLNKSCVSECPTCPIETPTISIEAKFFIHGCEDWSFKLNGYTADGFPESTISWTVSADTSITDDVKSELAAYLNGNVSIPAGKLLHGIEYTFEVAVSNPCYEETKTESVSVALITTFETFSVALPSSSIIAETIAQWWESHGILSSCSTCPTVDGSTSCTACKSSEFSISDGCVCQDMHEYIDIADIDNPSCKPKLESELSWEQLSVSGSQYTFSVVFSNDFFVAPENFDFVKTHAQIFLQNSSVNLNLTNTMQFVQVDTQKLVIRLTIPGDIEPNTQLLLKNLESYNTNPFTPFYLINTELTHTLTPTPKPPQITPNISTTLSPAIIEKLSSASAATGSAMMAQSAATSMIPLITGGMSGVAVFLISFLADIGIYKFIDVEWPENFLYFCEQTSLPSLIPNAFSMMMFSDTSKENYNSTLRKFQEFEVSIVMLENAGDTITKDLFLFIVLLLAMVVTRFSRQRKIFCELLDQIKNTLKWNGVLSFCLGDFPDLFVYCLLQFREDFEIPKAPYSIFSLATCILITVGYPVLIIVLYRIVNTEKTNLQAHKRRKNDRESRIDTSVRSYVTSKPKPYKKEFILPKTMQMLSEGYVNRERWFNRNFMFMVMLQNFLTVSVIVFLQYFGIAQSALYILIPTVYIGLIFKYEPFKSKIEKDVFFINQCQKIILGALALALGIDDKCHILTELFRETIGWTQIGSIALGLLLNVLAALLLIVVTIIEKIQEVRKKDKKAATKESAKIESNLTNEDNEENEKSQKKERTGRRYWYSKEKKTDQTVRISLHSPENPEKRAEETESTSSAQSRVIDEMKKPPTSKENAKKERKYWYPIPK